MQSGGMNIIEATLMCPITQSIMTDPVQGSDGQTYERSAIVQWLTQKQTSPLTNAYMNIHDLKVNAAIKYLVDQYHAGNLAAISNSLNTTTQASSDSNNNSSEVEYNISYPENENKIMSSNYGIVNGKGLISIFDKFSTSNENVSVNDLKSLDVILCIDRSGSMATLVEAKNESGKKLEDGFTQQDIVNHAAKTVAKSLQKNDRISVITFDNNIDTLFDLLPMTPVNESLILSKISNIKPGGQTNIWGAIKKAYELLEKRGDKSRNSVIMLFTDGVPNISPARGEVDTLKRSKKSSNFDTPLWTFGFGYNLQRGLLFDLAKYGNGSMGHIPDGGLIATVFSNFLSTIQCSVANNIKLYIESCNDSVINDLEPVMGEYQVEKISKQKYLIYVNNLQIQQSRHIVINFEKLPRNKHTICAKYYFEYNIGNCKYKSDDYDYNYCESTDYEMVSSHIIRYTVVENIRKAINLKSTGTDDVDSLIKLMETTTESSNDPNILNLKETLNDQIKIALSNHPDHKTDHNGRSVSYFMKWGEFYLDQLSLALNNEMKPNFKDKACFGYGGDIFNELVDKCSDIFDTLEPPKPSGVTNVYSSYNNYSSYGSLNNTPSYSTPASLSNYNDPDGGCFDSNCMISMADNSKKLLKELEKGDKIITLKDHNDINSIIYTKVVCIYETIIERNINMVCLDNDLKITEWHPILTPLGWKFPSEIKKSSSIYCDSIITLVLEDGHVAFINDRPCITLGHNFKDGILDHNFYGSEKVIDNLKEMPGYEEGHIKNNDGSVIRDDKKFVIKINYS